MTADGLHSGRAGAAALRDAFDEFLETMVEAGGPAYSFANMLKPGLDEHEIRVRFAEHGIDPPDELVTYWVLQDGLRPSGTARPPQHWQVANLDTAFSWWRAKRHEWEAGACSDSERAFENPSWFELTVDHPMVASLSGSRTSGCYVRRIDPEVFDFSEITNRHQFASICTIFDVLSDAIRLGFIVPFHAEGFPAPYRWEIGRTVAEWDEFTCFSNLL